MTTLERIETMINQLPPLSPTAPKLARLLADPNSTIDQIIEVLRYDEALTLDILRFANSAAAAPARTITTVKDAVIRIGGTRILEWIMAHHIRTMVQVPMVIFGYAENELWRHSVAAALAAEQLTSFVGQPLSGLSFTAALLHDIGKLIIERLASAARNGHPDLLAATGMTETFEERERLIYGCSHADIGAEIATIWELPHDLVEAIRHHHSLTVTNEPITDLVRLCNIIAHVIGEGIGDEGMSIAVDKGLITRIQLSNEQFESVCAHTSRRFETVLAMLES